MASTDPMDRIKNMIGAITDLPPLPPRVAPFTAWFEFGRKKPLAVLMLEADMSLVRMHRCYHDLTELHYDHARAVNFRCARATDIDATYATALMGGEPYSDWN